MVASIPGLTRERKNPGRQKPGASKSPSFALVLKAAAEENEPEDSYTVTYDRQSNVQAYYYRQAREYTF